MNVCLIVCMFVWLYVCLFVPYTNPHFWTDRNQTLHTSPPWSGRDPRVCMGPKFFTSSTFWAIFLQGPLQNHGHKMDAGATVFRDTLISVVPAGVRMTSPTLRCRWRRSHPRQPYIRDSSGSSLKSRKLHRCRRQSHPPQLRIPYSGGCSRHVMDITFNRAAGPSTTALYLSFQHLFLWPTGNHVLADDSCAFLLQVFRNLRNAYDTLGRERDPCVYNSEPHQAGTKWLRNCNYTNNV